MSALPLSLPPSLSTDFLAIELLPIELAEVAPLVVGLAVKPLAAVEEDEQAASVVESFGTEDAEEVGVAASLLRLEEEAEELEAVTGWLPVVLAVPEVPAGRDEEDVWAARSD